jgi:cysteinyl-tRNA synthetase
MTSEAESNGIQLKLFNTLNRRKEALIPMKGNQVLMYTCGPTIYNFAHIGNFRTYIFEDLLRRTIKFFGMDVNQAMNLTDIDDKTIAGAIAQKVSLSEFTNRFKDAFFEDLHTLNIEKVEHYPAATEFIPQMIELIEKLIDKGVAYKGGDGSIYFAIDKFPHYGCLSHFKLEDLKAGASKRVSADEYDKESAADFVLWKKYDPQRDGDIFWESPFGKGRPGWHLECSAMAMSILGETIDIHVGGVDNMFPHHENEIAQSEACTGKQFARLWMHSEHLIVDNKKMSKSLGNFYTLRNLLEKGFSGIQVRYMLLHTHYRTQLNFTFEGLEAVKSSLQRLQDFIRRLQEISADPAANHEGDKWQAVISKVQLEFTNALADDLNISAALAAIFDFVREANALADAHELGPEGAKAMLQLLRKLDSVLGVLSFEPQEPEVPKHLQEALEQRLQARKDKNWALADNLRDLIINSGYLIEDTHAGARLKLRDQK